MACKSPLLLAALCAAGLWVVVFSFSFVLLFFLLALAVAGFLGLVSFVFALLFLFGLWFSPLFGTLVPRYSDTAELVGICGMNLLV